MHPSVEAYAKRCEDAFRDKKNLEAAFVWQAMMIERAKVFLEWEAKPKPTDVNQWFVDLQEGPQ